MRFCRNVSDSVADSHFTKTQTFESGQGVVYVPLRLRSCKNLEATTTPRIQYLYRRGVSRESKKTPPSPHTTTTTTTALAYVLHRFGRFRWLGVNVDRVNNVVISQPFLNNCCISLAFRP